MGLTYEQISKFLDQLPAELLETGITLVYERAELIAELRSLEKQLNNWRSKMKTYTFTVKDPLCSQDFTGETYADTLEEATRDVKEWYAHDLGTDESELIVNVKEKTNDKTIN